MAGPNDLAVLPVFFFDLLAFLFGDFFFADFLAAGFFEPFFFGDFLAGFAALRFFAIVDGSFTCQRPSHFEPSFPRALYVGRDYIIRDFGMHSEWIKTLPT